MIPAMWEAERIRESLKGPGYYVPMNVADLQRWFDEEYPKVETHMKAIAEHRNRLMKQVDEGNREMNSLMMHNTDLVDRITDLTMWRSGSSARHVVDFAGDVFVVEKDGSITHATRMQAWLYRRLRILPKPRPSPAPTPEEQYLARYLNGVQDER